MKEGIIVEYDGFIGEIESDNTRYIFLTDDVNGTINIGETVTFRGEKIHNINRAFFVKKKVDNNNAYGGIS